MSNGCVTWIKKDPHNGTLVKKNAYDGNFAQKRICEISEDETNTKEVFYSIGTKLKIRQLYQIRSKETYYQEAEKVIVTFKNQALEYEYNQGEQVKVTRTM